MISTMLELSVWLPMYDLTYFVLVDISMECPGHQLYS